MTDVRMHTGSLVVLQNRKLMWQLNGNHNHIKDGSASLD